MVEKRPGVLQRLRIQHICLERLAMSANEAIPNTFILEKRVAPRCEGNVAFTQSMNEVRGPSE